MVEMVKEAKDQRLKEFNQGKKVNFNWRGKTITGKVVGFSETETLNTELVWITSDLEVPLCYRADEVTFVAEIKDVRKKVKKTVKAKASKQSRPHKLGKPKQKRLRKKAK